MRTGGGVTTTDKADIDRAVAFAVAELRRRGGTAEGIAALVKLMSVDNQESEATDKIPDHAPPKAAR